MRLWIRPFFRSIVTVLLVSVLSLSGVSIPAFATSPVQSPGIDLPISANSARVPDALIAAAPPPILNLPLQGYTTSAIATCANVRANPMAFTTPGKVGVVCLDTEAGSGPAPTRNDLLRMTGSQVNIKLPQTGPLTPQMAYPNPQDRCAFDNVINTWYYAREWACYIQTNRVVNTVNTQTGLVLGTATYGISHAFGLDPNNGTWSNFTSLYLASASGDAANIVDTNNFCRGGCSTIRGGDPLGGQRALAVGTSAAGTNNLADDPSAGVIHNNLGVSWTDGFRSSTSAPGYITSDAPAAANIRCDAQANTGLSPGCAIPNYTPQLQLRGYGSGNSSTALVYWFQYDNVDHWGQYPNGRPLTRLNNQRQASANRAALCQDGVWQPDPSVTSDSCDEFPFASSYQSGNLLGLNASQCSQGTPVYDSNTGRWTVYVRAGYDPAQRCVLGHVALTYNKATGGSYSSFIQNNRLLDSDPFWIGIE